MLGSQHGQPHQPLCVCLNETYCDAALVELAPLVGLNLTAQQQQQQQCGRMTNKSPCWGGGELCLNPKGWGLSSNSMKNTSGPGLVVALHAAARLK
jgi:hypothetical protein